MLLVDQDRVGTVPDQPDQRVLVSALAAAGAFFGKSRHYRLQLTASVLIAIGVVALVGLSALGGAGGGTGRSMWWLAICVSYPGGWVIGLVGAVALLREVRYAPA